MHGHTAMADSRAGSVEHTAKRARVLPSAAEAADSTVRLCEELASSKWQGVLDQSATDPAGLYDAFVSAVKAYPVDLSDEEIDAEVMEGSVPAALCGELKEVWEQPGWDDSKVLRVRVDDATRVQGAGVVDLLIRDATHTLRAVCIPARGKCSTVLAAMYGGAVADVHLRHTVLVTREFNPVKNRHEYVSRKRFLVLRYTDVTAATGDATGLDPSPVHPRPSTCQRIPPCSTHNPHTSRLRPSATLRGLHRPRTRTTQLSMPGSSPWPSPSSAQRPGAKAPAPRFGRARGGTSRGSGTRSQRRKTGGSRWARPPGVQGPTLWCVPMGMCCVCSCMHARACNCHLDTFDGVCGRVCVCVCTCLRTQASSGPCTRTALCTRQDRWTCPPACASPTTTRCRKCAAFWWTTPTRQMAPWQTGMRVQRVGLGVFHCTSDSDRCRCVSVLCKSARAQRRAET